MGGEGASYLCAGFPGLCVLPLLAAHDFRVQPGTAALFLWAGGVQVWRSKNEAVTKLPEEQKSAPH